MCRVNIFYISEILFSINKLSRVDKRGKHKYKYFEREDMRKKYKLSLPIYEEILTVNFLTNDAKVSL